jgi:hypothetical protein
MNQDQVAPWMEEAIPGDEGNSRKDEEGAREREVGAEEDEKQRNGRATGHKRPHASS